MTKNDIAKFVKKTDFDNKLKELNKNELNERSKKAKAISTKTLTKSLINKFSILNGAKYFSSGIFQNYLVFIPATSSLVNNISAPERVINLYVSYTESMVTYRFHTR